MLSEISDRLSQAVEKKKLKEKIERDLIQVGFDLDEKTGLLDALERQLKKEQVDVEKLERLNLSGLFYSVLGSREQQAEKERQELLSAQLKYQQAKHALETIRADQVNLERQLRDLRGIEDQYTSLLERKEALLRQANPRVAGELVRLSEEVAARNVEKREIDEAIAAASDVLSGLEAVVQALESAEGWGTWDLLGGGFLSTMVKHSRIDEAHAAVEEVQDRMNRFHRELADVQRSADLQIEIGDLEAFADYFFDGLIVDWIVQEKIHHSLDQARQFQESITASVEDLSKLSSETQKKALRLEQQRAALIEQG